MELLEPDGFSKEFGKRVGEMKSALIIGEKLGLIQSDERAPQMHFLKTWIEFFDPIVDGNKRFDLRKKDRDYRVGDLLILARYDRLAKKILPGFVCAPITYILESFSGIKTGYCILGFTNCIDADQPTKDYYMFHLTNHIHSNADVHN